MTENGIQSGTTAELEVELAEGYDGLELISDNKNLTWTADGNKIRFTMPASDLAVTLRAYRQVWHHLRVQLCRDTARIGLHVSQRTKSRASGGSVIEGSGRSAGCVHLPVL